MKKFYVLLVVIAMVFVSSIALAAEVTVGGNVSLRNRDFSTLGLNKDVNTDTVDTQTKWMIDVNAKAGDAKAKISLWNDFDTWGGAASSFLTEHQEGAALATGTDSGGDTYSYNNNTMGVREAWVMFQLPYTGFTLKGGHQLLMLGNGLFFRNMHFGSDAWVLSREDGANQLALINVKLSEGNVANSDDVDTYSIADTFKINEDMKIGADLTMLNDRKNKLLLGGAGTAKETQMQNIGVNFAAKVGPVALKAEIDQQAGKAKGNDAKFKGNLIYVRGDVAMDPASINFTVARGSGAKSTDTDYKEFVTVLDVDPHYTFLYEYKIAGACGLKNQGFCNTTAVNVGAMFAATKNLSVGADLWYLMATEKVDDKTDALTGVGAPTSSEIGLEVDVKVNWKIAENISWNWNLGYLDPGKGLGKDPATGVQGILSMSF